MLTLALAAAAMIPPPPGWTPPHADGPGAFCGRTFTLQLVQGERLAMDWPGEMFINDSYGTYRISTAAGAVVVSEDGARTRPAGRSQRIANGRFRSYGATTYSIAVPRNQNVKAVTVRFPAGTSRATADGLLRRISLSRAAGTQCLAPHEG